MPPLLAISGVEAGYGGLRVLHGVTLDVPSGATVAVLGLNGAGKSTLLKTVAGLLRPSAGTIAFDGADVTTLPASARAARGMCLVPEGRGIFPAFTVEENLGVGRASDREGIEQALELLPALGARLRQTAGTMSGGEQQMLAVARAIAAHPKLLLLDELSLGLAPAVVDTVFEAVTRMRAFGVTVVLVEQYVSRALAVADLVAVMDRGRIRFAGEPEEMRANGAGFAAYLGRAPVGGRT